MFYAQLDAEKVCIGVAMLAGEVDRPDLVAVSEYSEDYIHRKYDVAAKTWSKDKFVPPQPAAKPAPVDIQGQMLAQMALKIAAMDKKMDAIGKNTVPKIPKP